MLDLVGNPKDKIFRDVAQADVTTTSKMISCHNCGSKCRVLIRLYLFYYKHYARNRISPDAVKLGFTGLYIFFFLDLTLLALATIYSMFMIEMNHRFMHAR